MCYGLQDGFAAPALVVPRPQRGAQPPLDHRVDRLRLPPLPLLPLVGRPPALRSDDGPDALGPDAAVDPLGIEVRIGQERPDPGPADGLHQGCPELHQVRPRAPTRHRGQDQVAGAIDHEDDLRVRGISRLLVAVPAARAALDVVPARVPRLQPRAIDGGQRDASLADSVPHCPLEHRVEHRSARDGRQESGGGLPESGEVEDGPHADLAGKLWVVGQMIGQAAVVEAQELLEHQAGQQLGLGELLGAVLVSVRRDGLVGGLQDPAWGSGRRHISYYNAMCTKVHSFLQSSSMSFTIASGTFRI